MAGAWQLPGMHLAGGAESSTSCLEGKQEKNVFQTARKRVSKPPPTVTQFFQEDHTYSNKTTPPHVLIPELNIFKPPQLVWSWFGMFFSLSFESFN